MILRIEKDQDKIIDPIQLAQEMIRVHKIGKSFVDVNISDLLNLNEDQIQVLRQVINDHVPNTKVQKVIISLSDLCVPLSSQTIISILSDTQISLVFNMLSRNGGLELSSSSASKVLDILLTKELITSDEYVELQLILQQEGLVFSE